MDLYPVRRSILQALKDALSNFEGDFLDVGCGQMPYRPLIMKEGKVSKYVGMDFEAGSYAERQRPDLIWDGRQIPLDANSIDSAMATEVLEHCPDPSLVLKEIYRVLKPGGAFFLTVPFLWPLHDIPYDEFRYTPFAMERMLLEAGFDQVELNALGGWDASLAQMLGLWVRRRPMNETQRVWMSRILYPFYRYLLRKDKAPQSLEQAMMITGLSGLAFKP